MKRLSPTIMSLYGDNKTNTFLLIDFAEFHFTTLFYDYYDALLDITYSANNGILSVDPPRMSDKNDKQDYKIVISDPEFSFRARCEDGTLTGKLLNVRVGFINKGEEIIEILDGTEYVIASGSPFKSTVVAYSGYLNSTNYIITPDESITFTLESSAPFGSLNSVRNILTSRAWLDQNYPNLGYRDRSYDQVLEKTSALVLNWGKLT